MTILVKIFGDLRKKIEGYTISDALPLNLYIDNDGIDTIEDILNKYAIDKEEKNMSLLYKWYFERNEDE